MPKATLEFRIPEEREEFDLASRADELLASLIHIQNLVRAELKHGQMSEQSMALCLQEVKRACAEWTR